MSKLIYLASPYSGTEEEQEERYRKAMYAVHLIMKQSLFVYSPIVHCHELAKAHDLPKHAEYWKEYNHLMLSRCDELFVLLLSNWQSSKGVAGEIEEAVRIKLPIFNVRFITNDTAIAIGNFVEQPVHGRSAFS